MSRCLITAEEWLGPGPYSPAGLRSLDRRLTHLEPLSFTHQQLLEEAALRAGKMSIQGVQPKLSAVLRVTEGRMALVDAKGRFILKPAHTLYREIPENEALTMSLAATMGIDVPLHGLLRGVDGTRTYFIRRFDREGRDRLPVEDFAQLGGASRDTKYESSVERLIGIVDRYCSFPAVERVRLFERLLFCFLTGNEDMHLKNWSLITRADRVELAPAYDLLNSTIVLRGDVEETALPLNGQKRNLRAPLFWRYLASDRLQLPKRIVEEVRTRIVTAATQWPARIATSFLSPEMQERYLVLVRNRFSLLELGQFPG